MAKSYVIIGASAAGIAAANKVRQLDQAASIVCISDEAESPYNKCFLADYLSGTRSSEQVAIFTSDHAQQKNIQLLLGTRVVRIIPDQKSVVLENGKVISYDSLFIATGTSPRVPAIPGIGSKGVFNFHGMAHAQELLQAIVQQQPRRAVVIGAGLSGLECADALKLYGIQVAVIERDQRPLPRLVNQPGAQFIESAINNAGVSLHTQESVAEILGREGRVAGVRLESGAMIETDLVVCALGAVPNSSWLAETGITMRSGWVCVDEHLRTSVSDIYAGGDLVMIKDQLSGEQVPSCTWPDAMQQGIVAAHNMVGVPKIYPGALVVISSSFFGIKFASAGSIAHPGNSHRTIAHQTDSHYKHFLIAGDQLKGFLIIGPTLNIGKYRRAILTGQTISTDELLAE